MSVLFEFSKKMFIYQKILKGEISLMIKDFDKFEYKQLSMLNLSTPQEIVDAVILSLIESGII